MRKHLWKAVAVAGVLVMTVSALTALAAEKTSKPAPAGKASEQTMPGCGMKGGMAKEMPGCSMKGGMAKEMPGCGMKGGMGKGMEGCCCCKGGDMKSCGMKGGMGKEMAGCGMKGEMGKGMPGCGMKGEMGKGMPGCGPMGGPGMGPGMGMGPGPMMQGLDLTADQQKKLADIHERQARQAIQAQADLRIATMDLQKLVHADSPDKGAIDAQIDKLAQLRAQMAKSRMATMLEVRSMLTPEQLKKWHAAPMGEDEDFD
jgi:Spy/CpxP family protein refolding chaperone